MNTAVTYTGKPESSGQKFTCKRCKRVYAYPQPNERPIRCECGWWYFNDGSGIREAYQQRIEPYRTPDSLRKLFS